jgi:hypothetical protein
LKLATANRTTLAGTALEALACSNGEVKAMVAPRAWTRVAVYPA